MMGHRDGIEVFVADDNLITREGVRALLDAEGDIVIVGVADDYSSLIDGVRATRPQVVVTDIRMPPRFEREGLDAAVEIRREFPSTGIVILSQYEEPSFAVALMKEGSAGYAYLIKDRVAAEDQLPRAVREVAVGGTMMDSSIVDAIMNPVRDDSELTESELSTLEQVAQGRSVKAIAARQKTTPEAVASAIDRLLTKLGEGAGRGQNAALRHLRTLQAAIAEREELGQKLSGLLPAGVADRVGRTGSVLGESEMLHVSVAMSDVRGFCSIAERADAASLARQLNEHYAQMNAAVVDNDGTVMQFVGDCVFAVFGAPVPQHDHADRALAAARSMQEAQSELNHAWVSQGLPRFDLGIGISTGKVAAALIGSDERFEYSLVGDTVNLAQRLQQWASGGEIVLSDATFQGLTTLVETEPLTPAQVKGREGLVHAHRLTAAQSGESRQRRSNV